MKHYKETKWKCIEGMFCDLSFAVKLDWIFHSGMISPTSLVLFIQNIFKLVFSVLQVDIKWNMIKQEKMEIWSKWIILLSNSIDFCCSTIYNDTGII